MPCGTDVLKWGPDGCGLPDKIAPPFALPKSEDERDEWLRLAERPMIMLPNHNTSGDVLGT
jgi:hypothetical protein